MDYDTIHGHDVANFSTPLTHRVLTVSAADVDADLLSQSSASSARSETLRSARFVPTGIDTLDAVLSGVSPSAAEEDEDVATEAGEPDALRPGTPQQKKPAHSRGGFRRGQLTEIWGPPGAGKTAFGMQLVTNALGEGNSAVWIDCFHPLCDERLKAMVEAQGQDADTAKTLEDDFEHYCIPADASLLVIDSLSALVNYALPRTSEAKGAALMANGKKGPTPYEKRTQVLQYITAALERLAETYNLAVVLLTQCASRVQAERGAALAPAINAIVWDRGVNTRLVLFRDWAWKDSKPIGGRFLGVQKLNGTNSYAGMDHIIAFDISETGLVEEHYNAIPPRSSIIYKRKLGEAGLEAGDSDDDNYGWDDDDSMPNMPPQWQGSEDLLLGHRYEEEEEEEHDDDDEEDADEEPGDHESKTNRDDGVVLTQDDKYGNGLTKDEEEQSQLHVLRKPRGPQSVADSEEDSDV